MSKETTSNKSETDWTALDAMSDEDIDFSDCPEVTSEQFANAVVRQGLEKTKNTEVLEVDNDILEWFKSNSREYQAQINNVLRDYIKTH